MSRIWNITAPDNGAYAFSEPPPAGYRQWDVDIAQSLTPYFDGAPKPYVERCPDCGMILDKWNTSLHELTIPDRRYDLSFTVDGVPIVSLRFIQQYERQLLAGLSFRQLPGDPEFYSLHVPRAVSIDERKCRIERRNRCQACGQYEEMILREPAWVTLMPPLESDEFARTDIAFSWRDGQSYLLLCGKRATDLFSEGAIGEVELHEVQVG